MSARDLIDPNLDEELGDHYLGQPMNLDQPDVAQHSQEQTDEYDTIENRIQLLADMPSDTHSSSKDREIDKQNYHLKGKPPLFGQQISSTVERSSEKKKNYMRDSLEFDEDYFKKA